MLSNKKGQGESGGAIVTFVLVLIIAAVIAFATYTFFFKINTTIDAQAIETTNMILSCQKDLGLANTDDAKLAQYCGNFKYPLIIGGKKSYVNCAYLEQKNLVSFNAEEVSAKVKLACNSTKASEMAYNNCLQFNQTHAGESSSWVEYVNGIKCTKEFTNSTFGVAALPETVTTFNLSLTA